MCVTDDHKIDSFYAFIHAAHFHNPYFFVRKDARRMRSLNVSTAVRDIYWLIQGVTFCAVYIYAPSLSAEPAADQSAELQIQRVSPRRGGCGCASDKPAIGVHSLRAGHCQQMCALRVYFHSCLLCIRCCCLATSLKSLWKHVQ